MAGKISDKQLRRQALKLKDPYEQPSLAWEIPADAHLLDIFNLYVYEQWPQAKVFCVQCRSRRHKHGFTAMLTNGTRVLLGSSCGAELFGESWTHAERRMKDRADRQWELDRLDRLESIAVPMRDALLTWLVHVERMMARKDGFFRMLGELASRVSEAANVHGGRLTVGRQVNVSTAQQAGMRGLSTQFEHVTVGELHGPDLFRHFNAAGAVERSMKAIEDIRRSMVPLTDDIPTKVMKGRRRAFEDTFEGLETAARMYTAGQEFFTKASFQNLANWTQRHAVTNSRYVWTGDGIDYGDGRRGFRLPLDPFKDLSHLPLELIQEYRRAD